MMDSWKYLSEGKGVWLSEELDFPFDGHGSCKNKVVGSEIKPFFNVENYPLVSNAQAFERLDLMELGLSDEIRKSYSLSSEPSGEVFSNEIGGTDSCGNVVSPFCEEKDSGPRISSDFSLIDLKLGRLVDGGGGKDDFSRASVPASSNVSSLPVRRARSTTSHPRTPCCQVFGCNKDLSSYKGYYKRHKVCDVHTKTAKVIIEGIEQRFCQQCSRFHLLAEFDDGKRSCRRRLAAHNKRRRKPQHASKPGSRIIGFSSSFSFPDMLPSAGIDSGEGMGNMVAGMKDNMLNLERFSGIQQSSSALSLLSAESHNMSSQLLGAAITSPLINKSSHTDSSIHSANNSEKIAQSGFHTPGMYSVGANHVKPTIINHCDGNTVDLKLPDDGMSMGPYLRNDTNYHNNPLGRGIILDLLQLSSRLQRIEHQKHSTESEAG